MKQELVVLIRDFVRASPLEVLERVALSLEGSLAWQLAPRLPYIPSPELNMTLVSLLQEAYRQGCTPSEVALAIQAARAVEAQHRAQSDTELVLSGPAYPPFTMRRTDEAILQVINSAQHHLTLVSFAIFRVQRLTDALANAARRDVAIRLFVEPDTVRNMDIRSAYGDTVAHMKIFFWCEKRRESKNQEATGVLHAKTTVADSKILFISSANLTESAMSRNVEIGILVHSSAHARQIDQLFDTYLERGLFEAII